MLADLDFLRGDGMDGQVGPVATLPGCGAEELAVDEDGGNSNGLVDERDAGFDVFIGVHGDVLEEEEDVGRSRAYFSKDRQDCRHACDEARLLVHGAFSDGLGEGETHTRAARDDQDGLQGRECGEQLSKKT